MKLTKKDCFTGYEAAEPIINKSEQYKECLKFVQTILQVMHFKNGAGLWIGSVEVALSAIDKALKGDLNDDKR